MAISVEACRSLSYRAVAEYIEKGPAAYYIISIAKAYVCEEAFNVVNEALQQNSKSWCYSCGHGFLHNYRLPAKKYAVLSMLAQPRPQLL